MAEQRPRLPVRSCLGTRTPVAHGLLPVIRTGQRGRGKVNVVSLAAYLAKIKQSSTQPARVSQAASVILEPGTPTICIKDRTGKRGFVWWPRSRAPLPFRREGFVPPRWWKVPGPAHGRDTWPPRAQRQGRRVSTKTGLRVAAPPLRGWRPTAWERSMQQVFWGGTHMPVCAPPPRPADPAQLECELPITAPSPM